MFLATFYWISTCLYGVLLRNSWLYPAERYWREEYAI